MAIKRLMEYYNTKSNFLSKKQSESSFLANITMIHSYSILVLIKYKSSLARNIIGRASGKMLRLISKIVIYVCI